MTFFGLLRIALFVLILMALSATVGALFFVTPVRAYAPEQPLPHECERLRALERQYRGVSLSAAQHQVKAQLVAWYNRNCRPRSRG